MTNGSLRTVRAWVLGAVVAAWLFAVPASASAEGPNAIMKPAGYDANVIARGDDNSVQTVVLPFSMNWFGTTYNRIYINQNGNITFTGAFGTYTPTQRLNNAGRDIIAPFWADVDTGTNANPNASQTTYSSVTSPPQVDGRNAVFINWIDVGYYNHQDVPLNSFQVVLVDRSDTGAGNFDMYFNYDKVLWDRGSASGTRRARAGWGRQGGTYYEFPGSGSTTSSPLLDGGPASTSLIQNYLNTEGQLGRYVWQVRSGLAPNQPPKLVVVDRVLEGNASGGYTGYTGVGDGSATDPEGGTVTIARTPPLPGTLPLGISSFSWSATDTGYPFGTAGNVAVATMTQTIEVTDTTPPSAPVLSSPTHAAGAWSSVPTVTMNWTASADVCAGMSGYSYSWSANTTALPDVTTETAGLTVTNPPGDGVWYFNIRPVDRVRNAGPPVHYGPIRIDTVRPVTTHDAPPGWATTTLTVTLSATDAPGVVALTRYRLDTGALTTYTTPLSISVEGTHTLAFQSIDAAGNTEVTRTATIRVDRTPPVVPAPVTASALDTGSVEVSWAPSTDAVSGLAYYSVVIDGTEAATTTSTTWVASGLNAGQAYSFTVRASDIAGNMSAAAPSVVETVPIAMIWLNVSRSLVDFGGFWPAIPTTFAEATTVTVGGVGPLDYDLWCTASDFSNIASGSPTPTMPIGVMGFDTYGRASYATRTFTTVPLLVHADSGVPYRWRHDYRFDYSITLPWTSEPGTYTTGILYTAVTK